MKIRLVLIFLVVASSAYARDDFEAALKDRLAIIKNERDSTASEIAFEKKMSNNKKAEQLEQDLELLNKELDRLTNPKASKNTGVIREAKTRVEPPETRRKQTESLAYESWDIFNDFGKQK